MAESAEQTPGTASSEEAQESAPAETAEPTAEPSEGSDSPADDRSLVFLDASSEERSHVETLGDELGWSVWAVDPAEFSEEMVESLSESAAVVVAWDLRGRPGLDVVEALARDPRMQCIPIALSAEAPTAALVRAAWRAGARTFLTRPYEASELSERLLPLIQPTTSASEARSEA